MDKGVRVGLGNVKGWPWGSVGFGDFFKDFLIIGQILSQMLYYIERKCSSQYYLNVS